MKTIRKIIRRLCEFNIKISKVILFYMDMQDSLREMNAFLKPKLEVWKEEETYVNSRNVLIEKHNVKRKRAKR